MHDGSLHFRFEFGLNFILIFFLKSSKILLNFKLPDYFVFICVFSRMAYFIEATCCNEMNRDLNLDLMHRRMQNVCKTEI